MKKKFKLLENDDIYDICEFMKNIDILSKKESFVDPYMIKSDFDNAVIKNTCFNYSRIYFGLFKGNKLVDLCIIEFSQYPLLTKIGTILFLSSINSETVELINFAIQQIKELFDEYKKIVINIDNTTFDLMGDIIRELEFNEELHLENELGYDKDVYIYTKFF